jgi:hypothetical protein
MTLPEYTPKEVQDMLDAAQLDTGYLYANTTILRDQLQLLFRENLMECNSQHVDQMELLLQTLDAERTILDAYNRHRLGNAITRFNKRVIDPESAVEYRGEENIPEQLDCFPLRAQVAMHGINIKIEPIYQVGGTEEDRQSYTSSQTAFVEKNTPPYTKDDTTATAHADTTPTKTVKTRSTAGTKKPGFGSLHYDKLKNAPSPWLSFPHGNLTLSEVFAFIPHAIKSFDIMDRFLYNGALSGTFADLINEYRDMPHGPITNNTVYRMMKAPMNHRAKTEPTYKDWTVAKHAAIPRPAGFDSTSISVAGCRTPFNFNSRERAAADNKPAPSIPFRDMANSVKVMPSGYDALDLTRCVQCCVDNGDSSWVYPQDFQRLIAHLGGAATVHRQHRDDAAISRHTTDKKQMNARRAGARQRDKNGRLLKQQENFVVDSDDEEMLYDESGEESEEDQDGINFDALDEDDEPVAANNDGTQHKHALGAEDDVSDEGEFTPRIRTPSKRKQTAILDSEDDEETPPRQNSKRSKKSPSKTPARRSPRTRSTRVHKEALPEETDSESDEEAAAGPRRNKATMAARSSARGQRFSGSHDV